MPPFLAFLQPREDLVGKGIGHFVGAMRVDAFRPVDDFKKNLDIWIESMRACQTAAGHDHVIIPGDPEREMTAERMKTGIPLLMPVVEDLQDIAKTFNVEL